MKRTYEYQVSTALLVAGASLVSLALAAGCGGGDDDTSSGGSAGTSTAGSSSTSGGSSASGGSAGTTSTGGSSGTTSTGSGGSSGSPLRPPNPRTDIGPADGVTCKTLGTDTIECAAGQQCCPGDISGSPNECQSPGDTCAQCSTSMCAVVTCDGPEDCPNQLCCARSRDCTPSDSCGGDLWTIQCEDSCEGDGTVVCKDPRDCLHADDTCDDGTNRFVSLCF